MFHLNVQDIGVARIFAAGGRDALYSSLKCWPPF